MDKDSIIGLFLIAGILIGWMYISAPTPEEIARKKQLADSVAQVEQLKEQQRLNNKLVNTTAELPQLSDSLRLANKHKAYGDFIDAATGDDELISIENDLMRVSFSKKGGKIASVELINYKTFDDKPLILFDSTSTQSLKFSAFNKQFSTDSLYFTTSSTGGKVSGENSQSIAFRLNAGDPSKYIEYVYTFKGNDYMIDFRVNTVGMHNTIVNTSNSIVMNWNVKTPIQEKHYETQQNTSAVYFKQIDENVDYIGDTSDDSLVIENNVKWVGFKQQFFTSTLIAGDRFDGQVDVKSRKLTQQDGYIKDFTASLPIPYAHTANESFEMSMYFGPNHFKTLKKYDLDLEKQIKLGWKIFGWINRLLTIPIFNFLNGFNWNYGIIILALTLIIKALLLPIAYKTILSSAKMKVLKPEIDELNEKHKDDDPMKKQQATMALYKQAGVSPMAGCVPVMLQMPILIALFSFFPSSIELRQQGFLWCNDLSSYDSVYEFGFEIPFYGDHISLFALLMTVSTLLYTWSNSQVMGTSNQMPGMKWMMYLMPIMFLGFLNSYSAGLSWYYFLANMITFTQTWVIQKYVIDSDALHAQIQENKKKPVKMSKFQQKIEQMAKERQGQAKTQSRPKKK